jgi:hypothetical protein
LKTVGYLLIAGSFLSAAYLAVRELDTVSILPFLVALAFGALGVGLVRASIRAASRDQDTMSANLDQLVSSLDRIVKDLEHLDRDKDTIDVYELRHHIDRTFPPELDAFVQARESLVHRFGLAPYAEVMGHFAAGERHLNRVWSASTDGYIDEAHTYVTNSKEQMTQALAVVRRLLGST